MPFANFTAFINLANLPLVHLFVWIESFRNSSLAQEEGHGDLCSSDSLNYSRDGLYSHPAATADATSADYHDHPEPPGVSSRFTLHPHQHQHRRWCLRFGSLHCFKTTKLPLTIPCSATFPAGAGDLIWRFCNPVVAISAEFGPLT